MGGGRVSDPYRDSGNRETVEAPQDRGIVGDVIAQFADLYAFYRELVQNSIDAGTPDVAIELNYDEGEQKMRASVRDRGDGMTREIIEKQLLVLFRSSKEKDKSKIGKFGVGFASVLAPNPEVVIVNSSRDGQRLTLHLYRDLTYELFDGGRATQTGTTVELELAITRDVVAEFEHKSEAALKRWCRHASVPIELTIRRGDGKRSVRIDSPLSLEDAVVQVRKTFDGGELTVVAALPEKNGAYLGFFNHGLMLHETTSHKLGGIAAAVKIQDSRLGHTISRDDVRRDDNYKHAVDTALKVVQTDLCQAVSERMRELAEARDAAKYTELVQQAVAADLPLSTWYLPLVEIVDNKTWIASQDLEYQPWTSKLSTPLTQTLAEKKVPVVLLTDRAAIETVLDRLERPGRDVHHQLTAITAVEHTDHDVALVATLRDLFDTVHRAPADILFVRPIGARDDLIAVALHERSTQMLDRDDAVKNPFAMLGRRVLALSTKHPLVRSAREADDPVLAATHLARAVLLQYGLLDESRSHKVLLHALAKIGVGS